jgi:hypothetical protein
LLMSEEDQRSVALVRVKYKGGPNQEVRRLWNATTMVEKGTLKGIVGLKRV